MIFVNVGVMLAYLTGTYMSYQTLALVMMLLPIGVFVSFIFIPDTPMSLLERNKSDDAIESSLKFYLNTSDISAGNDKERFDSALEFVRSWGEKQKNNPSQWSWKNMVAKDSLIGFGKALAMIFFSIFSGSPVLQNYSSIVFKNSGSNMNPNTSAIIMIVIQVMATIVASAFVDNVGRRTLLIVSSIGTSIGLFAMGTYAFLTYSNPNGYPDLNWVPVVCISFTVFLAYIGLLPLIFVVIMEVLPAKARESYATLCLSLVSLFIFLVVKCYPVAAERFQMHSCMWFFAVVAFAASIFGCFVLEETKGKNVNMS
ncbi:Facilitated trehalose transporter Tret1 [Pseudolycoriella hygida]|uniref:Facilitated trehalose transporter Tret1 n=1 Tax=Pseudolycoriella hygida TaxID=35572 RepID=A0A9Q0N7S1_9DIPT|nr:Facilitated trehalose transporter Tret1 [Pseudolycoriella hygida]